MAGTVPRIAEPACDNAGLCELARRCPQGQRFRFYHHRHNYWERARLHRESEVLVIDGQGRPAAAVTFARKGVWLAGASRRAVYVFDLMVDPEYRGAGHARRLLHAVRQRNRKAELFYCYIVEDNLASRRLFESEGYRQLSQRVLYHLVLPLLERRRPPRGFHHTSSAEDAAAIDAMLRQQYDFLDSTAGHDGLFLLDDHGSRAWAALRRHEPQVFLNLPWYARLLGRLLPVLPAPGRPVSVWSLHHLGGMGRASALLRLIRAMTWLASRERIDTLVLPLFENDPLTAVVRPLTLTRWGIPPGVALLHAAGDLAPLLVQSPKPLILSGQDA